MVAAVLLMENPQGTAGCLIPTQFIDHAPRNRDRPMRILGLHFRVDLTKAILLRVNDAAVDRDHSFLEVDVAPHQTERFADTNPTGEENRYKKMCAGTLDRFEKCC